MMMRNSVACIPSVSVRFRNKEHLFFGSRFISCVAKTENPVPQSFFAPIPNGNACYPVEEFDEVEKSLRFGLFKVEMRTNYLLTVELVKKDLKRPRPQTCWRNEQRPVEASHEDAWHQQKPEFKSQNIPVQEKGS